MDRECIEDTMALTLALFSFRLSVRIKQDQDQLMLSIIQTEVNHVKAAATGSEKNKCDRREYA